MSFCLVIARLEPKLLESAFSVLEDREDNCRFVQQSIELLKTAETPDTPYAICADTVASIRRTITGRVVYFLLLVNEEITTEDVENQFVFPLSAGAVVMPTREVWAKDADALTQLLGTLGTECKDAGKDTGTPVVIVTKNFVNSVHLLALGATGRSVCITTPKKIGSTLNHIVRLLQNYFSVFRTNDGSNVSFHIDSELEHSAARIVVDGSVRVGRHARKFQLTVNKNFSYEYLDQTGTREFQFASELVAHFKNIVKEKEQWTMLDD